mmetsp:Transcript_52471/g.113866  ORF Transcript_52471/g.113866 Transcript_52471/m.113866 type:complete len:239 (+) Transcript_52471:92-808(+)|eukprot:CAMPEP_0175853910 /NCGR_PEP_ID=MMETSP0107_2-20121207/27070_1 /TAXON_ID=195067 ORGANISM="Goniomonas pacifica, Strain CCMP1869" /NCGR_SAMPLE_ID=MMETSP0107_2 /ASSEMBLY_ACC=CAM_ASM_000203 /LENGTH=238 /DNA_ID=CAMNT_0017169687 /DNA_START=24 /DNA_END=740 /DNA_ORIENTATION=+
MPMRPVTFEDLSRLFHYPERAVARELGVCLTSLKKICRQHGIARWPYRKLRCLERKIDKVSLQLVHAKDDPSALVVQREMLKLERNNLSFLETDRRPALKPRLLDNCSISPQSPCTAPQSSPSCSPVEGSASPGVCVCPGELTGRRLLQERMRQVGTIASHRNSLRATAHSNTNDSPVSGDPQAITPPRDDGDCPVFEEPIPAATEDDDFFDFGLSHLSSDECLLPPAENSMSIAAMF